jgi:hypothetical protein
MQELYYKELSFGTLVIYTLDETIFQIPFIKLPNVHVAMLDGSLVTTAWRVLRLRMEVTPSSFGG